MPIDKVIKLTAALIRQFEGLRLTAYWDAYGKVWTIGYGHTGGVTEGQTITLEEAEDFLVKDCQALFNLVSNHPPVAQAALVSFGYNCGIGTLTRVIKGEIAIQDGAFIVVNGGQHYGETAGGKTLPGLVTRRTLEAALIEASS